MLKILKTFEQALIQLEQLQQQIWQLNSGMVGDESVPGSLVISLLMDKSLGI